PEALQRKVLKGENPITVRPGSLLEEADLKALRGQAEARCGHSLTDGEFASSLMYPKVFDELSAFQAKYGPVAVVPTPVFFYGLQRGQEITVDIEVGKTLLISLQAIGETGEDGQVWVYFELNGHPRIIRVPSRSAVSPKHQPRKADESNSDHVM